MDEDVFNIDDFTAVTPVEQLAHQLESIMNEWNIAGRLPVVNFPKAIIKEGIDFESIEKKVNIGEEEVIFTYTYPKTELPPLKHNLVTPLTPSQLLCDLENVNLNLFVGHPITAMFGTIRFCTLRLPSHRIIATEDDILYLRNAFVSAAEAAQCFVPCFVMHSQPAKQLYSGIAMGEEAFTIFESGLLRRGQKQHMNLNGLISLFKNKIDTPTFRSQGDLRVSVMFEYEREKLPEKGIFQLDVALVPTLDKMCIGTIESPVTRISLLASWPNQSEDVLNEGHNYCDLEETNAFHWQFMMNFEPKEGCMSKVLRDLLDIGLERDDERYASEFRCTITKPRGARTAPSITNPTNMDYDPEHVFPMTPEKQEIWLSAVVTQINDMKPLSSLLKQLFSRTKSYEPGSVLERLSAAYFSLSVDDLHWKNASTQLYIAFVDNLRAAYPRQQSNPDLQVPNYSKCRLHQLLEMLQLCANNRNMFFSLLDNTVSEGMDVFFDAEEDVEEEKLLLNTGSSKERSSHGRLEHHQNLFLLDHPDAPLYNFYTQNPKPHTEMEIKNFEMNAVEIDEHNQYNKYIAPLRSDMQAFKAANPLGKFEDFVRWHSPKDFDEETKELSERFSISDNDWIKLWTEVSAAPVISQEKLFNDASVMEEIFDEMENATVLEVAQLMIPMVFTRAAAELIRNFQEIGHYAIEIPCVKKRIEQIISTLDRATNSGERDDYLDALRWIRLLEKTFMVYKAVYDELNSWIPKSSFDGPSPTADEIDQLACYITQVWERGYLAKDESTLIPKGYNISGGATSPLGLVLHKLMCNGNVDAQNYPVFPKPSSRYYTIHWVTVSPSEGSRPVPHRMTGILKDDEFRICGSFTSDYKRA